MATNKSFKLVLVGDGGSGKTKFITRHLTSQFHESYTPTVGRENKKLSFLSKGGWIHFDCWEIAAPTEAKSLEDVYFLNGQCAIIMFDVTNLVTYENVPQWHNDIRRMCDNIPIVLCGNKVDVNNRQVTAQQVMLRNSNLPYYDISVRSGINLEQPFLYLARQLLRDGTLQFMNPAQAAHIPQHDELDDILEANAFALIHYLAINFPNIDDDDTQSSSNDGDSDGNHSNGTSSSDNHSSGDNNSSGTSSGDNHSSGTSSSDNHSSGTSSGDNHSSGTSSGDNHSSGTSSCDNHISGTSSGENHSSGTSSGDSDSPLLFSDPGFAGSK